MENQQNLPNLTPQAAAAKATFADMRGTEANYGSTESANVSTEKAQNAIERAQEKARKRIEENNKKLADIQKKANTDTVINGALALAVMSLSSDSLYENCLQQAAKLANVDLSTIERPDMKSFKNQAIRKTSANLGLYDELLREKNEYIKMLQSAETPEQLKKFKEQMGKGRVKKPLDIDLINDLKSKGYSNRKVADLMGVSETCIRNRLKEVTAKFDTKTAKSDTMKKEDVDAIAAKIGL